MDNLVQIVLSALAVLLILTIHEYSHALAAYKLGDNTARNLGRLSLNPLKHLDPFGALCMVLFRFGWAKPVPINARNFKNPKRDFAIPALAGPLSNMIFAFISAFFILLVRKSYYAIDGGFTSQLLYNLYTFLVIFHQINIGIGLFNLIPIPPLDGSRILNVILPPKYYFGIMRYERKIYIGLIIWLAFGDVLKSAALSVPFIASNGVLSLLAGFLSLSDMLGYVIIRLSDAMLSFWQLIPFL
jgi:Zn-dependent protease